MININPKKISHRIRLQKLQEREHQQPQFNHPAMDKFSECINKFYDTLQSFGEIMQNQQAQREESIYSRPNTEPDKGDFEMEERFKNIEIDLPQISKDKEELQIRKWLGQLCKKVFSVGFKLYLNATFNEKQAKIFCCENVLFNIIKFVQKNQLLQTHLSFINNCLKDSLIPYFLLKYPQSEALDVNLRLSNLVTQIDNSYSNQNDFIFSSGVKFTYEPTGDYNSKIMQVLNYLIQLPSEVIKVNEKIQGDDMKEEEVNLYTAFTNDLESLFRKLEDETEVIRMRTDIKNKKKNQYKKIMTEYQIKKRQNYQEKVKEYTKYLIGRKIPENVSLYTDQKIKVGNLNIKSPQILRILTKWCNQLEKYFSKINQLVVDRQEQFRMKDGSEQYLKKTYRLLLKKLLQKQKIKINKFLEKVMQNNYIHQQKFMKKRAPEQFQCFSEQECTVGLFTAIMFKNNENYIIGYLNTLIHCIMTVQNQFEQIIRVQAKKGKKITNKIQNVCNDKMDIADLLESIKKIKIRFLGSFDDKVPQLVTFKISDLIRCKCSSREYQITALFNQIQRINEEKPDLFKIMRIKNRLEKGTKDILINIRYRNTTLIQVQLAVNPEKTKFIQYSDHFNHFLYELERGQFGPISQMCNVWINSDNRAQFYRKNFKMLNQRKQNYSIQFHNCEAKLQEQNLPFECDYCSYYWTDENTLEQHNSCTGCGKKICSLCNIQNFSKEWILQKIGIELKANLVQFDKVQFCKEIPEYGASINLLSKDVKLKIFRKINYGGKQYLFEEIKKRQDTQFSILNDITTGPQQNKFIKRNMIVKLDSKKNISSNEIAQKYFVPRYIYDCYEKEKMSILLERQGIKKAFFDEVDQYRNVTKINFSENEIKQSEWIIQKFPKLQIAVLSENKLETLHHSINKLQHLLFMNLNSNQIKDLPQQIALLPQLQYLNLNQNQLTRLPDNFSTLKKIKYLYISSNRLEQLVEFPPTIQVLDLNHNKIEEIKLQSMKQLKVAVLAHNKIKKIDSLAQLLKLQLLDLSYNDVSGELLLENLFSLQNLNLSYNLITKLIIKHENSSNSRLRSLDIGFNKITSLDDQLYENIPNIQVLNLANNKVKALTEKVKQLTNLKQLNITAIYDKDEEKDHSLLDVEESSSSNESQHNLVPADIDASLINLQILNMGRNQLKRIPSFVPFLKQLKQLYLSRNIIQSIQVPINAQIIDLNYNRIQIFNSAAADRLQNVKQLGLRGNRLKQISYEDMRRMMNLEQIDVEENPDFVWVDIKKVVLSGHHLVDESKVMQSKVPEKNRKSELMSHQQFEKEKKSIFKEVVDE